MRKKLIEPEVEDKILEIFQDKNTYTIKSITRILKEKYDIKRSPQVIKRYLYNLIKEKKIIIFKQ